MTPRKILAPNGGRAGTSGVSNGGVLRVRRHNVDNGMGSSITLPPSTAGATSIDINRDENRFNAITNSIN